MIKTLTTEYKTPIFDSWVADCHSNSSIPKSFYVNQEINLELMVIAGGMLFPNFEVVDGLVYLAGHAPEEGKVNNIVEGRLSEWQASFNRWNLVNVFSASSSANDDVFEAALEMFKLSWEASLMKAFPDKNFIIEIDESEFSGPSITFYQ